MPQYISLTLGDLSLTIYDNQIGGDKFPRLIAQQPASQRSYFGNFVSYGRIYAPPHVWAFQAYLSWTDWLILDALFRRQDTKRRTGQTAANTDLTIVDTLAQFQEDSATATRAAAASPWNTITSIGATTISYYAKYYARFAQPPEFSRRGAVVEASISLEETDRIFAP